MVGTSEVTEAFHALCELPVYVRRTTKQSLCVTLKNDVKVVETLMLDTVLIESHTDESFRLEVPASRPYK